MVIPANVLVLGQIRGKEDREFCVSRGLYMHQVSHVCDLYFCQCLGLRVDLLQSIEASVISLQYL